MIVEPESVGLLPDQQSFPEEISTEKLIAIIGSYIVETPASIADDKVNAAGGDQLRTQLNVWRVCIQHWIPIRNANRITGAVYCPWSLHSGLVSATLEQFILRNI